MTPEQDKSIQNQESLAVNAVAIENIIPELPVSPKKILEDMKGNCMCHSVFSRV